MDNSVDIKCSGYTLVEVMLVVTIAAILFSLAIPRFQKMIKDNHLLTAANNLSGALTYTRNETVKRGNNIHFGSASGAHVSAAASEAADVSWVAWIDADAGNDWDAGEEIRLWPALPGSVTVSSTNNFFIFNRMGEVNNADQFLLCDDRSAETGRQIDLLPSGLINSTLSNCP